MVPCMALVSVCMEILCMGLIEGGRCFAHYFRRYDRLGSQPSELLQISHSFVGFRLSEISIYRLVYYTACNPVQTPEKI